MKLEGFLDWLVATIWVILIAVGALAGGYIVMYIALHIIEWIGGKL